MIETGSRSPRVLAEHPADAGDDLAGAMTGVHDVGERGTRLLDVGLLQRKPAQGRAGARRYAGQRLIDLVGKRCRQLACARDPVHVSELGQGIAREDLRTLAALMLEQQPRDHGGLTQDCGNQCGELPAIGFQDRRLAKPHDAARRQGIFADAPALQLAPVIHRAREYRRSAS